MKHVYTRFFTFALISSLLAGCGLRQKTAYKKSFSSRPEASPPVSSSEAAPVKSATDSPVTLGSFENGTYTNTYAGFQCDFGDDWEVATAEELQDLPDTIQEIFADTEYSDAASIYTQIADMNATNATSAASINVLYTKLDTTTLLRHLIFSEEELLDDLLDQRDLFISSYAKMGIETEAIEKVTVDFLGEKRFAIRATSTWADVPYFSLQIPLYKVGHYGVTITFSSFYEDITGSLAGLFYPVD